MIVCAINIYNPYKQLNNMEIGIRLNANMFFDNLIYYNIRALTNDELKYIYWNMRYIISDILLNPFANPTLLYPLSVYYYEAGLSN